MGLSKRQKEAIIGMLLGDAWIQKTGERNARLRLEHSYKQKEYIFWKYEILKNYMQSRPKLLRRFNPIWKKAYSYYRCQTHSSPVFGKFRRLFYPGGEKRIPDNIQKIFRSPLTLAIWYLDDGYYYPRDRVSYIYLNAYSQEELLRMLRVLKENFQLAPKLIWKKKKPVFYFPPQETQKLAEIIRPYVIPSLAYKIPPTP